MNEVEKFLEGTEQRPEVDVLEAPLVPNDDSAKGDQTEGEDKGDESEGGSEGSTPRNRRERRLMQRLDAEAKSSAFLAGKLEALTEAKNVVDGEADYLKAVERIYGTDSPEAVMATDLLKKAITGARDDAENRAYARMKQEQETYSKESREAESELDTMIDDIEETYGFEFNETQERAFLTQLQKMSPKNERGEVVAYADPHAVFEVFRDTKLKKTTDTSNRAKDLSSRSMVKSGSSVEGKPDQDAMARYLHEQGIL